MADTLYGVHKRLAFWAKHCGAVLAGQAIAGRRASQGLRPSILTREPARSAGEEPSQAGLLWPAWREQ
ncbi:MAG TPA: hypothetical protein PLG97_10245, partial [Alcaligenes sp.]|nr:hypothetical protein [Alcaligenes sp.]